MLTILDDDDTFCVELLIFIVMQWDFFSFHFPKKKNIGLSSWRLLFLIPVDKTKEKEKHRLLSLIPIGRIER